MLGPGEGRPPAGWMPAPRSYYLAVAQVYYGWRGRGGKAPTRPHLPDASGRGRQPAGRPGQRRQRPGSSTVITNWARSALSWSLRTVSTAR